ncbi:MAG: pyrroline-5-carboxylate reductase [Thermoguttaceae bacterium]|nr:pyrroline-5-carboxylate reductase [Thermoguttaceae bacterium]MDW8038936.1 pyrroline-5-carboxylate reductase [Thermoguttaceae bacterium]
MVAERIGLIGAGQMATALACGWLRVGLVRPEGLLASDPSAEARNRFTQATQVRSTSNNLEVVDLAQVLVLAVKPQHIRGVLEELRGKVRPTQLVISVVAGLRLEKLQEALGETSRIVRVMPNTPCLVGYGVSAYCLGSAATDADGQLVAQLFGAVGQTYEVQEAWMDAVTGLSGSGPAYGFVILEALADAGVRLGLPRDVALKLAAHTLVGSAQMVIATGEHPAVLKDRVASPGGTTIMGLYMLERGGLRAALIEAVEAAARRSAELAQLF